MIQNIDDNISSIDQTDFSHFCSMEPSSPIEAHLFRCQLSQKVLSFTRVRLFGCSCRRLQCRSIGSFACLRWRFALQSLRVVLSEAIFWVIGVAKARFWGIRACKEIEAIEGEWGWHWSGEESERYRCEAEWVWGSTIFSEFSSWELKQQKFSGCRRSIACFRSGWFH